MAAPAFTADDQARLDELEAKAKGGPAAPKAASAASWSPEEEARLNELEAKAKPGLLDTPIMGGPTARKVLSTGARMLPMGMGRLASTFVDNASPKMLPTAGSMAGGAGGLMLGGPAGEYVGAGAGGAAGQSLEDYIEGKPQSAGRMLMAGGAGVVGAGMGNAAGSFAKSGIQDVSQSFQRPGAEAIKAAATKLGVKPTAGMLTNDYVTRNLENSLSQSPTVPGALVRAETEPVHEAMGNAANRVVQDADTSSSYQAGKDIKGGVAQGFENRLNQSAKDYGDIEQSIKHIPLNEDSLTRVGRNMRNSAGDEARLFPNASANGMADEFATAIENSRSVNDLKIAQTRAKRILMDDTASAEEKHVAGMAVDKIERLKNNSMMRGAINTARELEPQVDVPSGQFISKGEMATRGTQNGENVGRQLIGDLKGANSRYRGLNQDLQTFGEGSGLTRADSGPTSAIRDIRGAVNEDVPKATFDTGNYDYLQSFQKNSPKEFEIARQQKLGEIAMKSKGPDGKISVAKLISNTEKMTPEVKSMLFGDTGVEDLQNLSVLNKSVPAKVGSSDTPRGLMFRDVTDIGQNLKDIGRYGLLKTRPAAKALAPGVAPFVRPATTGLINSARQYVEQ